MKELCVVHLVRAYNGIEPFRHFLEAYRENPCGIEHDLLIMFKGFGQPQDTAEYRELLVPFRHATLDVSDKGFDITAYFTAVNRYSEQYRYFFFLNSYSVILDRGWLKKLHENISKPGVGLVGATGSWNSNNANSHAWFRAIYTSICSLWYKNNRTNIKDHPHKANFSHKSKFYGKKASSLVRDAFMHCRLIITFGHFPNYHIRTNAFMISGKLLMSLERPPLKTKIDAYKFESGKNGLTIQILHKGKRVIVVGKDGVGYEKEAWHESKTFWRFEQENLLVADNQTRDYQEGTPDRRRFLSSITWRRGYSEKQ